MRLAMAFAICVGFIGAGNAAPVTLLCTGSLTADGKQIPINGETAIFDLEKRTFKPPIYSEFPLTHVGENELKFGSELPTVSTWGSLDRVSGSLAMNVMRPNDRKAMSAGGTIKFLAWMTGKCAPAQRLF